MQIAVVCLYPREAAPIFTIGLVQGLIKNGVDTYAVLSDNITNINDWNNTLDKEHLFFCKNSFDKKHPFSILDTLIKIKRKLHAIRFDAVIFTFPSNKDLFISKFLKKKEVCMFLHDVIPHSSTDPVHSKKKKEILQKANKIVIMTKKYKEITCKDYNISMENILYIRIPVLTYPKSKEYVHKYNTEHPLDFLFFGRIEGYKGLDVLASAIDILNSDGKNYTVTIAGGGDFSPYAKIYQHFNNVKILNRYIDDTEIEDLFNRDNCVAILPYIDATQSGVIPMAFYYGIPVLATDVGGLKEQLFDGEVGTFCQASSAEDLARMMAVYIDNPSLFDEQVLNMKKYLNKLTWKNAGYDLLCQLFGNIQEKKK